MDLDDNKALARRMLGLWAGDSTDDPSAFLAPDYVNHQEPSASDGPGELDLTHWLQLLDGHRAAFPDCRVEILMQIAEADTVATRWRFSATNSGPYRGHPATGRPVTWTGIEIDRIRGERILESWVDWDMYRQLQTLGQID